MGIFYVDCDVTNVNRPTKNVTVPKLLVDSGSECTWIPQEMLKKLGVKVFKKDEPFLMAKHIATFHCCLRLIQFGFQIQVKSSALTSSGN